MSHISKIEIQINDLEALKQACKKLDIEFVRNQNRFIWYNGEAKCDHVIRVSGAKYEIGVIKNKNTFELHWDNWIYGGLTEKLGENASRLKKEYSIARVKNEAKKKRYTVSERKIANGTRLVMTI